MNPPQPLHVDLYKIHWLEQRLLSPSETVFQTYAWPLDCFEDIEIEQIRTISFRFEPSYPGEILINAIGFQAGVDLMPCSSQERSQPMAAVSTLRGE